MKKFIEKLDEKCESMIDFMGDHENVFAFGYIALALGVSIVSLALYGHRTKVIERTGLLRVKDLR